MIGKLLLTLLIITLLVVYLRKRRQLKQHQSGAASVTETELKQFLQHASRASHDSSARQVKRLRTLLWCILILVLLVAISSGYWYWQQSPVAP